MKGRAHLNESKEKEKKKMREKSDPVLLHAPDKKILDVEEWKRHNEKSFARTRNAKIFSSFSKRNMIAQIFLQIFIDFIDFHSTVDLKSIAIWPRPSTVDTYENRFVFFLEMFHNAIHLVIVRLCSVFTDVDQSSTGTDLQHRKKRKSSFHHSSWRNF